MSLFLPIARGGKKEKGVTAEVVWFALGILRLGHYRRCNVLSLMWSAIGIGRYLYAIL